MGATSKGKPARRLKEIPEKSAEEQMAEYLGLKWYERTPTAKRVNCRNGPTGLPLHPGISTAGCKRCATFRERSNSEMKSRLITTVDTRGGTAGEPDETGRKMASAKFFRNGAATQVAEEKWGP